MSNYPYYDHKWHGKHAYDVDHLHSLRDSNANIHYNHLLLRDAEANFPNEPGSHDDGGVSMFSLIFNRMG